MPNGKLANTVHFDCFEVNLRTGELYRNGQKVALPEQSFRILELLIEWPGQLVTREEIRERLWPNGTIVEFENAVNAAVKKLRTALGDAADQPRYIETIKRRGYRLIVRVQDSSSDSSSGIASVLHRPEELTGKRVSHFHVLTVLGAGGMGVIYRAEDLLLGRDVALKFLAGDLLQNAIAVERLRKEARSASALSHQNICTIYEVGEEAGQPFIAMELLEGSSLRDRISGNPLPMDEVLDYASQIVEGLEAAHRKAIVHRDIKPANIFITNQQVAKILNFGLAKATALGKEEVKHLTRPGAAAGTVAYMSPEQSLAQDLDERSDLFSFGLVFYEMATGRLPPVEPPLSGLPPGMERIVSKCLEKDLSSRYQTASEIRTDLQRLRLGHDSEPSLARRWKMAGSIAAAVITILAVIYFYFHRTPRLADKDTIVLADFTNRTGDPVFDGTLRQGLAIQLEQSPFLSLISEQRIQQTLRLMAKSADAPLTPQVAREICERTGGAAVLEGSIASLGSQYVLALVAKNCRGEDVLDEQQAQAARKEDVLNVLTRMAGRFRKKAGESLVTIRQHSTTLSEATTPSLEALKAFSTGWNVHLSKGHAAALPWFKHATEIDPEFATAYAWLGRMYSAVGEYALATECSRKAWQLRKRASDHERFYIEFSYHRFVTGNLEKAIRACELWAQAYPRDMQPHAFLGSSATTALGKFEMAGGESNKAIELDPDHAMAYANLANTYRFRNQLKEAERTIQRAVGRKLELPDFQLARFYFAFLKNDTAEMERVAALSQEDPELQDLMYDQQGFVLAYHGRVRQARTISRRAVDLARQSDHPESAAQHEAAAAVREALFGSMADAREHALSALISNGRDAVYGAAIALALSKDDSRAQSLADDLDRRYPEDTLIHFHYLPTLEAIIASNHHDFSKAIELLKAATPYELGFEGCCSVGFTPSLYPNLYPRPGLLGWSPGSGSRNGVSKDIGSSRDRCH